MNVYAHCPVIENEWFLLRLVEERDCGDLLKVYSDPAAVPLFNSDNCNGDDFHYATFERMMEGIRMWLWSYHHGWFVRWCIVDKASNCAVGTVELFRRVSADSYNGCGILRLDLRSDYEKEMNITQILSLIVQKAFGWFGCDRIATKAKPVAEERIKSLVKFGYIYDSKPLMGHDGTAYGDYWTLCEECLCTT